MPMISIYVEMIPYTKVATQKKSYVLTILHIYYMFC